MFLLEDKNTHSQTILLNESRYLVESNKIQVNFGSINQIFLSAHKTDILVSKNFKINYLLIFIMFDLL